MARQDKSGNWREKDAPTTALSALARVKAVVKLQLKEWELSVVVLINAWIMS